MTDSRHLPNGRLIPTILYADQPYVVQTDDGAWLCCLTTAGGHEGATDQHVATMRSTDQGRTWSKPLPVEPPGGVENSYAVMLKVPSGRVYIFYNHNTDNVREVKRHDGKASFARVDSLGYYVFRYSDDHGRSWSAKRWPIPVRAFACDRENVYGGAIRFFWNVGRPFLHAGAAYCPLIKVGQMGDGFFAQSEGVLLRSEAMVAGSDPDAFDWTTLPDGDIGLRTPPGGGPISEEQSFCVLSDGSFYCTYRSTDGFAVESYSRDQGHTWDEPRYRCFADGRRMKHPRAATFAWRCANGHYLLWFHHHGGADYEDRNPVWFSGGVEADSPAGKVIRWSEPEIGLYDDDPYVRISYPDLIEEHGYTFVTETQKHLARVHEIAPELLAGMWATLDGSAPVFTTGGVLLSLPDADGHLPNEPPMPALPAFVERNHQDPSYGTRDRRAGFTLDLAIVLQDLGAGQLLVDSRLPTGQGLLLATTERGTLRLTMHDGRTASAWEGDPGLVAGQRHRVTVIVDGGPRIVSFVVDGKHQDGGDWRQFGWGRFSPNLRHANGRDRMRLAGAVRALTIYDRPLRTAEAIGNHRAKP